MKKALVVVLALVFACSSAFAASKARKEADPHKEKISVGFDAFNQTADVRVWASDSLGLEVSAGLGYSSINTTLGLNLGAGVLLPVAEGDVNFYIVPGIGIQTIGDKDEFGTGNYTNSTTITLIFGAALKMEVYLDVISRNLSIGSSVGAGLGIGLNSSSTTVGGTTTANPSSTSVGFGIVNGWVSPLNIRYYF